jgi:hypothetical protein
MIGLRTFGFVAILAATALPAGALPTQPIEQAHIFADCAGRFSALERHQWLTDGPASEATARQVALFADLLEAVLPDARAQGLPDGIAMGWRVSARAAQAGLLETVAFGSPEAASRADHAARVHLAACERLVPAV